MEPLTQTLLDELRDLALAIAPELPRLYVLKQQPDWPRPDATIAYVVRGGCDVIESYLMATGRWQGHAPIIVFVETNLSRGQLLAVLFHELAHGLPYHAETYTTPNQTVAEFQEWCQSPPPRRDLQPGWSYGDHGREFTRLALHLWWRAAIHGEIAEFEPLCAGMVYDLSPCFMYWKALGNEPIRMKDLTFAEIVSSKPPQLFNDFWLADLAHWIKNHPNALNQEAA